MKTNVWRIICALSALASLIAVIVCVVMGGCTGLIETAAGGTVPMKCHWAFRSATLVLVVGTVFAFIGVFLSSKIGKRIAASVNAVMAVCALILVDTPLIGICVNAEMHCHETAFVMNIVCAVALILSIVSFACAADKDALPKPKVGM